MAQNVMYLHLIPPDWIDIICLGWSLLICSRARTFEGRGVLREVRGGRQAGLGLRREERASHVRCQHVIATLYLLSDAISTFAWVWQFVGRNTQVSERETSTGECISFSAQGMWNVVTRDCTRFRPFATRTRFHNSPFVMRSDSCLHARSALCLVRKHTSGFS